MAKEIRLTNDEYLVLVLEEYLEEVGNDEIDCFDLTVRVWKKSNESFGLKKYEELYPDHKKIASIYMGNSKVVRNGWLKKIEGRQSMYKIGKNISIKASEIRNKILSVPKLAESENNPWPPGISHLSKDKLEFLHNKFRNPLVQHYKRSKQLHQDYNYSINYLGISTINSNDLRDFLMEPDNPHQDVRRILRQNLGHVNNLKEILQSAIGFKDTVKFRHSPQDNNLEFTMIDIIAMVDCFNLIIEFWGERGLDLLLPEPLDKIQLTD